MVVKIVVPSLNIECPSPGEDSTHVLRIQDAGELEQYKAVYIIIRESLVFFVIL